MDAQLANGDTGFSNRPPVARFNSSHWAADGQPGSLGRTRERNFKPAVLPTPANAKPPEKMAGRNGTAIAALNTSRLFTKLSRVRQLF